MQYLLETQNHQNQFKRLLDMTKQIEHNCVVCDKPIKRIMTLPNDTDWQGCWNGGIVNKISAGYIFHPLSMCNHSGRICPYRFLT